MTPFAAWCGHGFEQLLGGLRVTIDSLPLVSSSSSIVNSHVFGQQLGGLRAINDSASFVSNRVLVEE
jgi:hypothetical protein